MVSDSQLAHTVHIPVLLEEVLTLLDVKEHGIYLDATLGLGGHSLAIMEKSNGKARVIAIDRDIAAITIAKQRLQEYKTVSVHHATYSSYERILQENSVELLDGVLLDIGVSSMQLDTPERGFSFRSDAPLDMRMNQQSTELSAQTLLQFSSFEEIRYIIENYGEDPLAAKIARAIVDARQHSTITTTCELAEIVYNTYPLKWRKTAKNHPATRTFQAIRIAVNKELQELESFLSTIVSYVKPGARILVISFHSLEDRIVKNIFRKYGLSCICPPLLERCVCDHAPSLKVITKKPLIASLEECSINSRAKCAKLRVAERL
ncbi:MAG: 16S rRNA (cytosine(1402)-N(4))-methyltransferase RsmH [Desulfovibrionaceae bacterium]